MADVLLFHHVHGLTDGVREFADVLRADGHRVETPDLFDGRTFETLPEGMAYARETGREVIRQRGLAAAESIGTAVVYAGFSMGVSLAQELAQTRPGGRGALLMYSCIPVEEFGSWPRDVPVQIHGKESDEFFDEDLPAARELTSSTPNAELFIYPGGQHLFADSTLPDFDSEAAQLLRDRVVAFLARV